MMVQKMFEPDLHLLRQLQDANRSEEPGRVNWVLAKDLGSPRYAFRLMKLVTIGLAQSRERDGGGREFRITAEGEDRLVGQGETV